MGLMKDLKTLIEKYNRAGPRYTSYPPVPFWTGAPKEDEWLDSVRRSYSDQEGLDLYVHVPYCEKLCFYCGCNRTITKNHDLEDPFLQMVLKEWKIYCQKLGMVPKINSLHFGGGTPTFLSPDNLRKLIEELTAERVSSFIGSIEIDPRTCQDNHLRVLSETGISRVSLGIQDFDQDVQSAINRHQPVAMVEGLVEKIRLRGLSSINFDLVYGLPKQTVETVSRTIEVVAGIKPDAIAFYGYAHLPEKIKNQRLIKNGDLPTAAARRALYETGKRILAEHGYDDIGLDHFALPGNYLYQAKSEGRLHRNFMGYVDKKSPVLIGLGPTSISDSSLSFVQNSKDIDVYKDLLSRGRLPIEKGHVHTQSDLEVQELILNIMCNGHADFRNKNFLFPELIQRDLEDLACDGLITYSAEKIELTKQGMIFMRNVAMVFDHHLRRRKTTTKFSQTI